MILNTLLCIDWIILASLTIAAIALLLYVLLFPLTMLDGRRTGLALRLAHLRVASLLGWRSGFGHGLEFYEFFFLGCFGLALREFALPCLFACPCERCFLGGGQLLLGRCACVGCGEAGLTGLQRLLTH